MAWFLLLSDLVTIWLTVFLFIFISIIKIGEISIEYMIKYIIIGTGIFIYINPSIQPMCVIDEYAIMVRRWVWFNPINPPVNAFSLARNIISEVEVFIKINDIIDKGASFCHVDKISAGNHATDVITEGYHRWHGAIPTFIRSENNTTVYIIGIIWWDIHNIMLLTISRLDPRAWTNRYFTAASVSWNLDEALIIGMNEIKFSSIASQIISQFVLDIAITVLITMVIEHIIINGVVYIIKMRLELNHQIWVRSSYFARHHLN